MSEEFYNFKNNNNNTDYFRVINLAKKNIQIKNLITIIKSNTDITPPRTGHIGNWGEISKGYAGTLDYNKLICQEQDIGYPLIYNFNQTENKCLSSGDTVYLPGSIISDGNRKLLPIHTWNGNYFINRNRENSYFSPFVLTEFDGQKESLITVQKKRMNKLQNFNFRYLESEILNEVELVKSIFKLLIEDAIQKILNDRHRYIPCNLNLRYFFSLKVPLIDVYL